MKNKNTASRRNFIKAGFTVAGAGMIASPGIVAAECDPVAVSAPGPIPLNNILINFDQADKKYGAGLVKSVICNKAEWERKRFSILRRARTVLGEAPMINAHPVEPEVLAEEQREGYKELKVQFASGTGD